MCPFASARPAKAEECISLFEAIICMLCSACREHQSSASTSLRQQLASSVAGGVEAAAGLVKSLVSDSCYVMGGHVAAAEL